MDEKQHTDPQSADENIDIPGGGEGTTATFEKAFERLETVVRTLESGDVKLDESLKLFEEGVKLARLCSAKLDAAEGRIRVLVENDAGDVKEEPLNDLPGAASS